MRSIRQGGDDADRGDVAYAVKPSGFAVVGVGASAGGLEALIALVEAIPAEFGLAMVVIQHLAPAHDSMLASLLQRHTRRRVLQASDGMILEADRIYIIPPNAILTLDNLRLCVAEAIPPHGHRMPIDTFFQSLAENHADRAACVILSGSGCDGSRGLIRIKEHGGLAIAQVGATARHDGMPRSAEATGLVDHVLPAADIPQRLVDHFRHSDCLDEERSSGGLRAEVEIRLPAICHILNHRLGHDFSQHRPDTLIRRIERRIRVLQFDRAQPYVDHLATEVTEAHALFQDVLIGVSEFPHEPRMFETLESEVVPRLFDGKERGATVRAWVPGCATGEEAFLLAMLLTEHAEGTGRAIRVQVFGTDIDERALEVARAGCYPISVADQVGPERFARWFAPERDGVQVATSIREACVFSRHDLIKDPPFSRLDLVSCRNVLIDLIPELQKKIIQLFHYALRPDGHLILGPSESAIHPANLFQTLAAADRIFQRRDDVRTTRSFPIAALRASLRRAVSPPPEMRPPSLQQRAANSILQNFAPPHVVVDPNFRVLYFSSRTAPYLSVPKGAPSDDLLHLVKGGLQAHLRALVHQAVRTRLPARRARVSFVHDEGADTVDLSVQPLPSGKREDAQLLVVFQQSPDLDRAGSSATDRDQESAAATVQELESELARIRATLRTTVQELETANEELKSSNEELLSMNEELQSSNEEMETSKEELQSTNEELEALNTELHNKIEEVAQGHSDLRNLLESTEIATLFLDRSLRVKLFTPAARRIFRLQEGDVGRPLADIAGHLDHAELDRDGRKVLETFAPSEREVAGSDGSVFIVRILPYRTVAEDVDGLVMTFVEITELKRHQELLRAAEEKLRLTVERAPVVVCTTDLDLRYLWQAGGDPRSPFGNAPGRTDRDLLPRKLADELVRLKREVLTSERPALVEMPLPGRDGIDRIWELVIEPARGADGEVNGLLMAGLEITERLRSDEHRQFLLAELNHRVKNTLASIRSMIMRTLNESDSIEHLREVLDGRLRALARTHDLLTGSNWRGVPLQDLIEGEAAAYCSGRADSVDLGGPEAVLASNAVPMMAMATHELMVNAAKHGALSNNAGTVRIRWDIERRNEGGEDLLHIRWQECNGPPVAEPEHFGFGRQLVERGVAYELGGTVESRFAPQGFEWEARLPASRCLSTAG